MRFSSICKRQIAAITLSLYTQIYGSNASTSTTSAISGTTTSPPTSSSLATCEARTINYITHRLPQQCLKSGWQHVNGTTSTQAEGAAESTGYADTVGILAHTTESGIQHSSTDVSDGTEQTTIRLGAPEEMSATTMTVPASLSSEESTPTDTASEEDPAFGDATFVSFEDWKQQNLEKVGQNPEIGERRQKSGGQDIDSIHNALDSFGDEGEISLDFIGFTAHDNNEPVISGEIETGTGGSEAEKTPAVKPRSKDAGTTCKERFNYASFDAGSTIKKANPEAKSATKILSENKDSYMLNKCSANNKFFIVELSDDILVDTVVLANFEFFSSQFRQFRVSVSDRYPVKLDRWVDLGTYEAQNSRGIQAFLVEEPKIWARYLKIEFITHFGKEYYCPVSLLRVHGRTMISEFRAEEEAARGEADADEESEGSLEEAGEKLVPEAIAAIVLEEKLAKQLKGAQAALDDLQDLEASVQAELLNPNQTGKENSNQSFDYISDPPKTQWSKPDPQQWPLGSVDLQVCLRNEENSTLSGISSTEFETSASLEEGERDDRSPTTIPGTCNSEVVDVPTHKTDRPSASTVSPSLRDKLSKTVSEMKETVKTLTSSSSTPSRVDNETTGISANSMTTKSSQINSKPNSTTSNPPSPTPSTQESFFKTVHKRLQFLEANSTLSLQYIESQSALLRDAFQKVEKRQLAKTTGFLESLNETVMNELRGFRQQYDQIWQSTVIELESQRERSEREILEVSRRMTLLADEVIFQKRMSIVQSLLLLLCLGLVLFSTRGQRGGYLELPMRHMLRGTSADINDARYGNLTPSSPSPSPSPGADERTFRHREMLRPDLRRANSSWEQGTRKRPKSYDSSGESDPLDRSSPFDESPPTPLSGHSKPLPEFGSSSPPRRSTHRHEGSVDTGLKHEEPDPYVMGKLQSNQRPGFMRTSTVIRHESQPISQGNGIRPEDAQYYVTPPPEDGLNEVYHNGLGYDGHIQTECQESSSEVRTKKPSGIARKPLPKLPTEVDDESDEETT